MFITGTKVAGNIAAFLRVEGSGSGRIVLRANDLEAARKVLSLGEGVPAAAVSCDEAKR